jgi:hypothetical protein
MQVSHSLTSAGVMLQSLQFMSVGLWKTLFGQNLWRNVVGGCMMSATYS